MEMDTCPGITGIHTLARQVPHPLMASRDTREHGDGKQERERVLITPTRPKTVPTIINRTSPIRAQISSSLKTGSSSVRTVRSPHSESPSTSTAGVMRSAPVYAYTAAANSNVNGVGGNGNGNGNGNGECKWGRLGRQWRRMVWRRGQSDRPYQAGHDRSRTGRGRLCADRAAWIPGSGAGMVRGADPGVVLDAISKADIGSPSTRAC